MNDLVQQLVDWKQSGEDIILFMDLNECAYTGELSLRLGKDDLKMEECFQQVNHVQAPASHF
jgi:hypothetical protein